MKLIRPFMGLAALALVAAACGGGGESADSTSTSTSSTTTTTVKATTTTSSSTSTTTTMPATIRQPLTGAPLESADDIMLDAGAGAHLDALGDDAIAFDEIFVEPDVQPIRRSNGDPIALGARDE